MGTYDWEGTAFYQDMAERVRRLWRHVNTQGVRWEESAGAWAQPSWPGKCSLVHFLQNRGLCWDVTDRGIGVAPMRFDLRSYLALSALVHGPAGTVDLRGLLDAGKACTHTCPGRVETLYSFGGNRVSISLTLPYDGEAAHVEVVSSLAWPDAQIEPYLLAYVTEAEEADGAWRLALRHFPIADETVSRNNSVTADPPREDNGIAGVLCVSWPEGPLPGPEKQSAPWPDILLCDRVLDGDGLCRLSLGKYPPGRQLFLLAQRQKQDKAPLSPSPSGPAYWDRIGQRLSFHCALPELNRQFAYSVHNSLFSRTHAENGETLFIHGRPDRGYGDCGKIHQSYQMYYPALLAGEYESVRSELRAFATLMDADGGVSFQLRVGGGRHHYDGLYSNAHYIMGVYRYLSMSKDMGFLRETVTNPRDGAARTLLDTLLMAYDWLEGRKTPQGVMQPCGWLDAWPPAVVAQAQVSFSVLAAYKKLAEILLHIGHARAQEVRLSCAALESHIRTRFYNETNGLFAEHLFADGRVRGDEPDDFWVHTQLWSHISGAQKDLRGLEACLACCVDDGAQIIPDSGMFTDYVNQSTDGLSDLSSGSTATWLLAAWPEISNLLAASLARAGRAEEALSLLLRQLPETLYTKYQSAAPFYYAEKYIHPHNLPWLCTWAGDPTFIEAIVGGFLGLRFTLDTYFVEPRLPQALGNTPIVLRFCHGGQAQTLRLGPAS